MVVRIALAGSSAAKDVLMLVTLALVVGALDNFNMALKDFFGVDVQVWTEKHH